jgi:hypothetical protein
MARIFALACLVVTAGFMGLAQADNHHNGHDLVKNKLNTNGKHVLSTMGNHTAHAHVKDGKVSNVEVAHKKNGAVNVTKYKADKKHHAQAGNGIEHHYVLADADAAAQGFVTLFVGFGFINDNGNLVIFWFPVNIVVGGDNGCVIYGAGF